VDLSVNPKKLPEIDPDLQAIIAAWPRLSADVRRTILHVVKATMEASERAK
jgi:hypothetical protein